jgi:hypothetical protein
MISKLTIKLYERNNRTYNRKFALGIECGRVQKNWKLCGMGRRVHKISHFNPGFDDHRRIPPTEKVKTLKHG